MKRTKNVNRSNKTELEKELATLYNVSKYLPCCFDLHEEYEDFWTPGNDTDVSNTIKEIRQKVSINLNGWLDEEEVPEDIHYTLLPIKTTPKLRPLLIYLKKLVKTEYQLYFSSDLELLPRVMGMPMKFFAVRPAGTKLTNSVEIKHKSSSLVIRGGLMNVSDLRASAALIQLLRYKPLTFLDRSIQYTTSIVELAETMLYKNPHSGSARKRVWGSLERIHSCSITETNLKGLRKLIHILDSAEELEEDSSLLINIYIEKNYIKLFMNGYLNIEPKLLYKLPDKEILLLAHLKTIPQFNKREMCNLGDIFKFYKRAGLAGITPKTKPYVRHQLKTLLTKLMNREVVKHYTIIREN